MTPRGHISPRYSSDHSGSSAGHFDSDTDIDNRSARSQQGNPPTSTYMTQAHRGPVSSPYEASNSSNQSIGRQANGKGTYSDGSTSDASSISTTGNESGTSTTQSESKQSSFLQRATKFFQQQFQLDLKLANEKAATTEGPNTSADAITPTNPKQPQAPIGQAPLGNTPSHSPHPPQAQAQQGKGISLYRQMPVITRDQLSNQGSQGGAPHGRPSTTQNYLQPPNVRGQRKISDPKLSSQNLGDSNSELRRRSSSGSRPNKSISPGDMNRSSPRRQRVLPSTAGRQPIGESF